jgi:uncharacterized protein YndB with AHSA1/START domain
MNEYTEREIITTRIVRATRGQVFRAWTDPDQVAQWWGPDGFTNTIEEMDLRPGGAWRLVMHGPDGVDYKNKSIYIEIAEPERIIYSHISDPKFRMTANFDEQNGGTTKVTMRMRFDTAADCNRVVKERGLDQGAEQTLERLSNFMEKDTPEDVAAKRELVITRVLNAPRELVFSAWTDPKHLAAWWGPKEFTNPVCELDLRPGGAIRIDMRSPDGVVYPMTGVFHEIIPYSRLVFTSRAFEKGKGGAALEVLNTVTFTEQNRKTTLRLHAIAMKVLPEAEAAVAGMEEGWKQSLDRLAENMVKV